MRLSYSTRGWEKLPWDKQVRMAKEMGYDGIEVYRLLQWPEYTQRGGAFHQYNRNAALREMQAEGLQIPCLDTNTDLRGEGAVYEELLSLLEAAALMKVPYISVYASPEGTGEPEELLKKLLPAARSKGVCILVKTSGLYADTARLRKLLESFASDELAALWDVFHPFHDFGEDAAATVCNLGAYIKHVHLRDCDAEGGHVLIGEGILPVDEIMAALSSLNYDGFISLEWKPEWMEDLQDPRIIFPHFSTYMRRFDDPRGQRKTLYYNHDGSGQYIWKQDELVDLTFARLLDRIAQEFPDQPAFRYSTLDYDRSYSQFNEETDRFARALIAMGVRNGSKVAIWATNVPEWFITFWAVVKIGAILVSVNTAYKTHEAEYLLRQSDTHTLVMVESALDSNYRAIMNEICPELSSSRAGEALHCRALPFLRHIITIGFREKGCIPFQEAMGRADSVPVSKLEAMKAGVQVNDVCNMQYTSGTTGFPKGVMLTHYNVINNGKCIGDRMGLSTADRMMIQVPMFHCFGMVLAMTAAVTHGTTMYPLPYFSAKNSLYCIHQEKITCFHGVPTMFTAMLSHPDYRKTDFSHIRTGIMAGSGCPKELMLRVAKPDEMNMTGITSVYGQTECAPGNTMSTWTDSLAVRTETVGRPLPHIRCKIVDPASGRELEDGQDGEFCAKGYNTMKGYYKMPKETTGTIDADGWLHSGDIARRNPDGTYCITGRLKDMIIRGGENIYPKEIEEFIFSYPGVKSVQVIGVPDERYGEEIMACVIPEKEGSLTAEEIREYVRGSMARHNVPKYVVFTDAYPLNAAGKVLKNKMRELGAEWVKKNREG